MKIHSSCEIEDFVETHLCNEAVSDTPNIPIYMLQSCATDVKKSTDTTYVRLRLRAEK